MPVPVIPTLTFYQRELKSKMNLMTSRCLAVSHSKVLNLSCLQLTWTPKRKLSLRESDSGTVLQRQSVASESSTESPNLTTECSSSNLKMLILRQLSKKMKASIADLKEEVMEHMKSGCDIAVPSFS